MTTSDANKPSPERGIDVEPYGLDLSWRLVSLARRRLPHWRDRIAVGNAIDWSPPMRFDVVQMGLDEVPPARRRELVERALREYLVPDGVLVFRAGRAGVPEAPTADEQLVALGLRPDGILEAAHPTKGELSRTAFPRA